MKLSAILAIAITSAANAALEPQYFVQGFEISHEQSDVDFQGAYDDGARFVYIKSSEGLTADPSYSTHFAAANSTDLLRGAYHVVRPDINTWGREVQFLIHHGGQGYADGMTLPPMLKLGTDPDSDVEDCYGLSPTDIVGWLTSFADNYNFYESAIPFIYTSYDWWTRCCAGVNDPWADLYGLCPLALEAYGDEAGPVPEKWGNQTIWQNSDSYDFGGSSDLFMGDYEGLKSGFTRFFEPPA
ncbi:hypothetical protein FQN54_009549 [Arachnomyces sp. PD_36]|nr:hypothetical protein FQN54_009549 [Arachnomyces sp. PD_36]